MLFAKLKASADKKGNSLGFESDNLPDKQWMVNVLSTLNIKDEIFLKDYLAPPVQKNKPQEKVIEVEENLMIGLPIKEK